MRDPVEVRLGNLASTLSRVAAAARDPARHGLVYRFLTEAEYFIDCTGPDADAGIQPDLAALQLELAQWRLRWQADSGPAASAELAGAAREFSDRVLEWSGLLR